MLTGLLALSLTIILFVWLKRFFIIKRALTKILGGDYKGLGELFNVLKLFLLDVVVTLGTLSIIGTGSYAALQLLVFVNVAFTIGGEFFITQAKGVN